MGYRLPRFPLELDVIARFEAGNIRAANHQSVVERGDAASAVAGEARRRREPRPGGPDMPIPPDESTAETVSDGIPQESVVPDDAPAPALVPEARAVPAPANDPGVAVSPRPRRRAWMRVASTFAEAERHIGDAASWLEREILHGFRPRRAPDTSESPLPEVIAPKKKRRRLRRVLQTGAIAATVTAALAAASLPGRFATLQALAARTTAIPIYYSDGQMLGAVPQADALGWQMADGSTRPIAVLRLTKDIPDFDRALNVLEGEHETLGISVPFLARAIACYPFEGIGIRDWSLLGLKGGRCAGGSTPLMQLSRTLRRDSSRNPFRKFGEALDAMALAWTYPQGSSGQGLLLANGLHFGQAAGQPIHGLRAASLAAFGREPETLELHQLAYLAALAKVPLRLSCEGPGDLANFEAQRGRARKALVEGFAGDPRQADALRRLDAMQPILHPAALTGPLAAGLSSLGACLAAAHPLLRAEILDSTSRLAVSEELKALQGKGGERLTAVKLRFDLGSQRAFKAAVIAGLKRSRDANWTLDPLGKDAAVLAFTSNADGTVASIYESRGTPQLDRTQRLGSISKTMAMLLLARANVPPSLQLCNLAWQGRQNAGGDHGMQSCNLPGAMIPVVRVFGKSLSLPVNDALRRRWSSNQLSAEAAALGFTTDGDAAASIAFGTAATSPRRAAALLAAMSRGATGAAPLAVLPRIIANYATASGWHSPPAGSVNLAAYFVPANARAFVAAVAHAPLMPGGTLAGASGDVLAGEIAKSGTDDLEGDTRGKYAIGAYQGRVWFAEVIPAQGVLGNGKVGILPLVRNVRNTSLGRPVN